MSTMIQAPLPTEGFIRLPQCLSYSGLCRTAFYSFVASGLAPKPRKVGRVSLWEVGEFREFLRKIDRGELVDAKGGYGVRA